MKRNPLVIGDLTIPVPIIQGGMGVGISLSRLAGAVSKEGGLGVISAAQPGYPDVHFMKNALEANLKALAEHIKKAKELSGGAPIGVNIMRASNHYAEYVRCCVEHGADVIISGAGLPVELPQLLKDTKVKFAPIVSSLKAAKVLFQRWDKRYQKVADFVVIEGPKAGGHLGFTAEDAQNLTQEAYDQEVVRIVEFVKGYEEKYGHIPVVFAGGRAVRDAVCEALDREGVYARKYFYPLVTDFECYRGRPGFDTSRVPVARRVSDGVATLPLYPGLADAEVDLICRVVREAVRNA